MGTATIEYKQKVWQFLERMKPGERHTVANICEAENTEKFIGAIKQWMDGKQFQGYVSFNKDYSAFYKTDIITFKKINHSLKNKTDGKHFSKNQFATTTERSAHNER